MTTRRTSPTDTRLQAQRILESWRNIDPLILFGDMTLDNFEATFNALENAERQLVDLEDLITNIRNDRLERRYNLWQKVKRARASAKAKFGDDSDIYERFGGTRLSERRARRRSTTTDES